MSLQHIRIVNWDKLQHYKDRNPPWIKLHREILTSETWVSSSNDDRALMVAIMLLAAECSNLIPANARYIQRRAYLEKEPDLSALISLNFIEIIEETESASAVLADASEALDQRQSTETERKSSEANASGTVVPHPAADFCKAVFDSGVSLLVRAGKTEASARSLVGRWRKSLGDAELMTLLRQSEVEGHSDPAAWMTAAVDLRKGKEDERSGNTTAAGLAIALGAFDRREGIEH